ncbi:SDR family oxidoreductase [Novosphingobium sp. FSY-8]|uniref:SDR family oxidoreductase n=1 Tax=Novosphingobium ovatum TaxID=1908523 RepID=A0ABW9XA96_9SPHN|nr:SDR family oxidoreductase [Novosphingobium ovatum]NBC35459.1 SDR family oxidoreductase [Novosphingobium ovatum]
MTQEFVGKCVVITGGSSGIGLETSRAFAAAGAKVAIIGRNADRLNAAVAELGAGGLAVVADMGDVAQISRAIDHIAAAFGQIDVVFANAGTGAIMPFDSVDEALWDNVMNVNLKGTFFLAQHACRHMTAGGSIILCGSVGGSRIWPGAAVYSASKAAIEVLGNALAGELVSAGIRVNVVVPGGIDTPIMQHTPGIPPEAAGAVMEQMAAGTPMRRLGAPREVADAVLFLASQRASYVTATRLVVDGGLLGAA